MFNVTSITCAVDNSLSAMVAFHNPSGIKEHEFGKKQLKRSTLIPKVTPLTLLELIQSSV